MDLGKMLADALTANQTSDSNGYVRAEDVQNADLDSNFNLTAAAEAFLAKVREAKAMETLAKLSSSGPSFVNNRSGAMQGVSFGSNGHTDLVPYRGEAE